MTRKTATQLDREIAHAIKTRVVCGECFMYAYDFAKQNGGTLKHGMVTHPWDKNDFWHAWVEKDGKVFDWQTEQRNADPVDVADFHTWWKPRDIRTYTVEDARKLAWRDKHYGPW